MSSAFREEGGFSMYPYGYPRNSQFAPAPQPQQRPKLPETFDHILVHTPDGQTYDATVTAVFSDGSVRVRPVGRWPGGLSMSSAIPYGGGSVPRYGLVWSWPQPRF